MAPPANLETLLNARIFPGMTIAETRLVKAFLAKQGADYDEASVDERVGPGQVLPPHITDQKARADWENRTKSRPDLVLRRGDRVTIVEAKEQLTTEGIWQVLGYRDLYQFDHPGALVDCIAIAEAALPTAIVLAKARGVKVFLYEFSAPAGVDAREEAPAS